MVALECVILETSSSHNDSRTPVCQDGIVVDISISIRTIISVIVARGVVNTAIAVTPM